MFRFQHRMRPRKLQIYPTGGPEARLKKLREIVTGLIRYERVEPSWVQADEARQYAERLIYLAIKNGDNHRPTMEIADYWLTEKDLIPKLFQVLVPRFQTPGKNGYSGGSYTSLHKQAVEYPGKGFPLGVLELKGNPYPPILPKQRETKHILSNVLLSAARQDYYAEKQRLLQEQSTQSASSLSSSPSSSSSSPSSTSLPSSSQNRDSAPELESSSVDPDLSSPGGKG